MRVILERDPHNCYDALPGNWHLFGKDSIVRCSCGRHYRRGGLGDGWLPVSRRRALRIIRRARRPRGEKP